MLALRWVARYDGILRLPPLSDPAPRLVRMLGICPNQFAHHDHRGGMACLPLLAGFIWAASLNAQAGSVDYARQVQPILAKHCYACHGPDESEGGLQFHNEATSIIEGETGEPAIVPGDAEASHLLYRITTDDEYEQMPPEGDRVSNEDVEILRKWIDEGAAFEEHWSFQPLSAPSPPPMGTTSPKTIGGIDAFIQSRLADSGMSPNPSADRATLIRRVTYDLTGLPPTAEEVSQFVNDNHPEAYGDLVERLLASHHYGERWGRHWLDLVRYAETNSFERDGPKPNAWKYRDYVIRSFNDDKPYDQFIREQLAGDLIDEVTTESLTATGFYRLGIWDDEPADPLQARYDELDDLVTTTGQVFLGLTINCARCHDHKIDPIPQTDYYGLLAFFSDVTTYGTRREQQRNNQIDVSTDDLKRRYTELDDEQSDLEQRLTELEQTGIVQMSATDQRATEGTKRQRNAVLKAKLRQYLAEPQWNRYQGMQSQLESIASRRAALPDREQVLGLAVKKPTSETFVLYRGNPHSPADQVEPHFPDLYDEPAPPVTDQDRRLVLANWIASGDNRLTARVMANRIWQHHFGRGIVRSPNNFGGLGVPPTHPLLLDYLANELISSGWSIKSLHRKILHSEAYRMSARPRPDAMETDPQNDLFWRFNPRRLSAEEVRDSILAATGQLNPVPYGPSFYPKISAEVLAGQSKPGKGWGDSTQRDRYRRSVYIHVKRSLLTPMLSAFDFPEPDVTCEERFATLQPAQAMSLLNSDFIQSTGNDLAAAVLASLPVRERESAGAFYSELLRRTLQREPTTDELERGETLLEELVTEFGVTPARARSLVAISVLNWNEFLFVF